MNTYNKPYLQPYKGMSTRHECPQCKTKKSFTFYIDGNTNKPIHPTVGRCEREGKCGYHYTPKQYFIDNPSNKLECEKFTPIYKSIEPPKPIGTISYSYVEKSTSFNSDFVHFLSKILSKEQIIQVSINYALGATKTGNVIFWQIDIKNKVRTGKIMQYNPITGHRIKHKSDAIDWVHNKLKNSKVLQQDYNLVQCFFGEHLLTKRPTATIAIVESEKSALIASCLLPDFIWLAAGNANGLNIDKCKVLTGRKVILYPDLKEFDKWTKKAKEIETQYQCKIIVSSLLENIATDEEKENGLDIADYIIKELKTKTSIGEIQKRFSSELKSMIEKNNALLTLIEKMDLVEIEK